MNIKSNAMARVGAAHNINTFDVDVSRQAHLQLYQLVGRVGVCVCLFPLYLYSSILLGGRPPRDILHRPAELP